MEREVASELLSIAVLLPLVALALRLQLGLVGLMLAYLASRAGFLAASLALGRSAFVPSLRGVEMASVTGGLRSSSVIGVIGLLVAAYETVDVLVLSRIDFEGVAFYSAAQRLIWPFVLVLSSIATALFPVLASHWPTARDRFETTLQHGIDASAALAGCAMCPLLAAPAFFMGIVGPQLASGAAVLEIMAVLGFAKAISSTLGPVLYVVHAQLGALRFIATALVAKTIGAMVLAPRFGFVGVAWGALCVEVVFAALPSVLLLQRASGYRVRWSVPLRVAVLGGVSAAAARMACGEASPLAALLALLLYAPGVFVLGGVRLDDVVALVQRRTS
jgi:O-antigen/teichoic acid export membrane protein